MRDEISMRRLQELTTLQIRVGRLFAAIAHGDEKHRAWLKQAIEDHFAGRPVQRPQDGSSSWPTK